MNLCKVGGNDNTSYSLILLKTDKKKETLKNIKLQYDDRIIDIMAKIAYELDINMHGLCLFSDKISFMYESNSYENPNPFSAIKDYISKNGVVLKKDYNAVYNTCISDFSFKKNIYAVYLNDFLKLVEPQLTNINYKSFVQDFIHQYFMHNNDIKEGYRLKKDAHTINIIKNKLQEWDKIKSTNKLINFEECFLLQASVTVTTPISEDFIDIEKLYKQITLSNEIPFVEYNKNTNLGNIIEVRITENIYAIEEDTIKEWLDTIKEKLENKNSKKIRLLKFKLFNYDNTYSTVTIRRNGKIEMKCSWKEKEKAGIQDLINQVNKLEKVIESFNLLNYLLPTIKYNIKMTVPNSKTMMENMNDSKINSTTVVSNFNIMTPFNIKADDINFELLNNYVKNNFNNYTSVVEKNAKIAFDKNGKKFTHYHISSELNFKYKQISNYGTYSEIITFLDYVVKNTIDIKTDTSLKNKLIEIISKKFSTHSGEIVNDFINNFTPIFDAKSTLEYSVAKSAYNPGIDVRINRSSESQENYKLTYNGKMNFLIISKMNYFIRGLLYNYLDEYKTENKLIKNKDIVLPIVLVEEDPIINENFDDAFDEDDYDINDYLDDDEDTEELLIYDEKENPSSDYIDIPNEISNSEVKLKNIQVNSNKTKTKVRNLERLREKQPELFNKKSMYGTKCQSTVQPSVMNQEDIKKARNTINQESNEIEQALLNDPDNINYINDMKTVKEIKRALDTGLDYYNNYYVCLNLYCPTCKRPISSWASRKNTCPYCSSPLHVRKGYNIETGELPPQYFPRLVYTADKKLAPCCGTTPYQNYNLAEEGVIKNWNNTNNIEKEDGYKTDDYILGSNKTDLPHRRLAIMPETIKELFKFNNEYCTNEQKEVITTINNTSLNCYYRMGTRPGKQAFLHAVTEAIFPSGELKDLLDVVFKNLTIEIFSSLKNGTLKTIFGKNTKNDKESLENFKNYMYDENSVIDERLVWDMFSHIDLATQRPFNIIIISFNSIDKKLENPSWLCPVGYDINDMYKRDRKSLVLIKYKDNFEIVVKYKGESKQKNILFPEHDAITKYFIEVLKENCILDALLPSHDISVLKEQEPLYAQDVIQELNSMNNNKYSISKQIIDSYNRVEYLVTVKNLKIPVNLYSKQIININTVNDVKPLPFEDTLTMLQEIAKNTNIPVEPKQLVKDDNDFIIGIITNSLDFIETKPTKTPSVTLSTNLDKENYYKNLKNANKALYNEKNIPDERVVYMEKKEYEDESYQRLRYELSKFIYLNPQFKELLKETINNTKDIQSIYNVIFTLIKNNNLVKIEKSVNTKNYVKPYVRTVCFQALSENNEDIHCYFNKDNKSQLIISDKNALTGNKDNYKRYLYMISNELLKYEFKRDEILENEMSNFSSVYTMNKRNKEYSYTIYDISMITTITKKLFQKTNPIINAVENTYDVKNPEVTNYIPPEIIYPDPKEKKKFKLKKLNNQQMLLITT
jgi:hypothetical protein|uniref:Uncharacterized protein n=1 Tax=viral metagenome TaxID=1070528 RepID=A0A6C0J447_9ZZZZ